MYWTLYAISLLYASTMDRAPSHFRLHVVHNTSKPRPAFLPESSQAPWEHLHTDVRRHLARLASEFPSFEDFKQRTLAYAANQTEEQQLFLLRLLGLSENTITINAKPPIWIREDSASAWQRLPRSARTEIIDIMKMFRTDGVKLFEELIKFRQCQTDDVRNILCQIRIHLGIAVLWLGSVSDSIAATKMQTALDANRLVSSTKLRARDRLDRKDPRY